MAARRAGRKLFDLTGSNPTEVGLDYPGPDILDALCDSRLLTYRPDPFGLPEARAAVAARYAARGVQVPGERIVLTASTSEAYSYLFRLLCDPGDSVLVPRPSYPLLEHLARLDAVELSPYFLHYDGEWRVDLESVASALGPRTRAIVVISPNNPTGSYVKAHELRALGRFGLPIISDEVFFEFAHGRQDPSRRSALDLPDAPVFVLDGLSKRAGMPQLKLGWMVVSGPAPWVGETLERLDLIADTYLSVGTPVQLALPRLLELGDRVRTEIRRRCRDNLRALAQTCEGTAVTKLHIEGGWSAVLRLPDVRSEQAWVQELLEREQILVQPGFLYDFVDEPYVVVSLLTPPDVFQRGIDALVRVVQSAR